MVDTLYVTKLICHDFVHTFSNGKATKDFNIEVEIVLNGRKYIIEEIVYEVEETKTETIITTTYLTEAIDAN